MPAATLTKATAVLLVDAVEPSLDFWQRRLGLTVTAEVPHDGRLGFAIVSGGGIELMLQSVASARADAPDAMIAGYRADKTYLFVETTQLDAIEQALAGCEVVLPRRRTFYGATEIGYREPGGHYVTFAQFAA